LLGQARILPIESLGILSRIKTGTTPIILIPIPTRATTKLRLTSIMLMRT